MKTTVIRVLMGGLIATVLAANGGCMDERRETEVEVDRNDRVVEVDRSRDRVVVEIERPEPPREVVIVQEAPPTAEIVVIYEQAPPRPIAERRQERPSSHHKWVDGYWVRHHNQWVWVSGQWEVPPRPKADWVKPRWEHRGPEYHFTPGYWR